MHFVEILDKMHLKLLKLFPNFTVTLHYLITHIIV